ncbi:MAG: PEP-CTERM sorting domain-containing protein [Burkholderiales bacterium]|nr:PEP-CTERM sorting domain-containing protein [Burkholderiales bacterium]
MTFVNAHCIPGTVRYPDGLNIAPGLLNDSASASFDRVYGLTSTDITVEFWYSSSISTLPNIPGNQGPLFAFNGESFNLNSTGGILATTHNPGANFAPSTHQAHFSHTFHAVVGGNHTLTFSTGAGNYRTLNVDDLKITVTSVPEPETYAMLLAGLGLIGAVARRRQSKQA